MEVSHLNTDAGVLCTDRVAIVKLEIWNTRHSVNNVSLLL
jgi:hypothetical protein